MPPPPPPEVLEQVQSKGTAGEELLLSAWNIQKLFPIRGGVLSTHIGDVRAVDGVSLDVRRAETVGLVGESGCGKTTVGRLLLRLIEPTKGHAFYLDPEKHPPPDLGARLEALYRELERLVPMGTEDRVEALRKIPAAQPLLKELDGLAQRYSLYRKKPAEMRKLRGKMQIVFQDPFSSLSPRMLIRDIISEPLAIHHVGSRKQRNQRVAELLTSVGLNPEHLWRFPHEFSGGQRQRIGIARALALRPDFIVLDEPTSALDVSVQAQILNILLRLQREQRLSYLFISHHLSVGRAVSHRVVVMYLGKVVERAPTEELFERPLHPYTQALLSAIPIPDPTLHRERIILSGDVPSPASPPSGCRFHTRCPKVMPVCSKIEPPLLPIGARADHYVACHLYAETSVPELGLMAGGSSGVIEIPSARPSAEGAPDLPASAPTTPAESAAATERGSAPPLPFPAGPSTPPRAAAYLPPPRSGPVPWESGAQVDIPPPPPPPAPTAPELPVRGPASPSTTGGRAGFAAFRSGAPRSVATSEEPSSYRAPPPAPAAVWRGMPRSTSASDPSAPPSAEPSTVDAGPPLPSSPPPTTPREAEGPDAPPLPASTPLPSWRTGTLSESALQPAPPASSLTPGEGRRKDRSGRSGGA